MASSGNFCTYNPLPYSTNFRVGLYTNTYNSVKNAGNTLSNPGNNCTGFGTMALTSGKKWYMEGIATNAFTTAMGIFELNDANLIQNNLNTTYHTNTSYKSAFYAANGKKYIDGTESSYGATFVAGDVIGMAVDLESGTNTITFYKNNASQGSFNLGTNGLDYLFCIARPSSSGGFHMNWGQDSTFAGTKTAGGNADGSGFGDFFYAVPSGHLAVCSANLGISSDIDPAQTDDDYPGKNFNVVTYTGTGSSNAISGLGFQPDLVWLKQRGSSGSNMLLDTNRGTNSRLTSNNTNEAKTASSYFTSFDSDGFTVTGNDAISNVSSGTFVAWCWRANGGTTSSNTDGTITSTVQANTAAGFSIVKFTGNGSNNATVGHGLDSAPDFIICKPYGSGTLSWHVFHRAMGTGEFILNSNSVFDTRTSSFTESGTTATNFTLGSDAGNMNFSGNDTIAYCWHSVEGYSKFGKYNGNGNADGSFVYTGFRPRMIILRAVNVASDGWLIYDTARETFNVMDSILKPHDSAAEYSNAAFKLDTFSNGFKLRSSDNAVNGTSYDPYIYMAWGDVPFKYNNTF